MTHFIYLFAILALLTPLPTAAHDLDALVDPIFGGIKPDEPGCNVGVIQRGELVYQKGFGLANLELDVPLDGTQIHRMGSVSKQFTAVAVLLLADEGAIDLDAEIHTYLPELPRYGSPVSVNAMLGHFSGMGDTISSRDPMKAPWQRMLLTCDQWPVVPLDWAMRTT